MFKVLKMEDFYCEIFRKNYLLLVWEMIFEFVVEYLYSDFILILEMKENVLL